MLEFLLGKGKCRENKDVEKKLVAVVNNTFLGLAGLTRNEKLIIKRSLRNPAEYVHAAGHALPENTKPDLGEWTKKAFDAFKEKLLSYCSGEVNNKGPWDDEMAEAVFLSLHGDELGTEYTKKYKLWWEDYQDSMYKFKKKINRVVYSEDVERGKVLSLQ